METEKICKKCGLTKTISDFTKCKACVGGYRNSCKECTRAYHVDYQKINPEVKEYQERYRQKNKTKRSVYQINYAKSITGSANRRGWYLKNKHLLEKKENRRKYRKVYNKNSLSLKWRLLLNNTLKRIGKKKEGTTIELLGYTAIDLKLHLESLFTEGMSWKNYGEWHIDHIIPISKFDTSTPVNVINSLSNLQPLWKTTREINGISYLGNLNKSNNILN